MLQHPSSRTAGFGAEGARRPLTPSFAAKRACGGSWPRAIAWDVQRERAKRDQAAVRNSRKAALPRGSAWYRQEYPLARTSVDPMVCRARGRPAAALEAVDAPVELGVSEHRLDHAFAFAVERASGFSVKDASHERIEAAVPARAGALAFA